MKTIYRTGMRLAVPLTARGTGYVDGGFDISPASAIGAEMLEDGIFYVCRHGTCCRDEATRFEDCPDCV